MVSVFMELRYAVSSFDQQHQEQCLYSAQRAGEGEGEASEQGYFMHDIVFTPLS